MATKKSFALKEEDKIYEMFLVERKRIPFWLKKLQAIQKRVGEEGNKVTITVELLNPATGLAITTVRDNYDQITLIGYKNSPSLYVAKVETCAQMINKASLQ
jgi:hypothetical protein